MTYEIKIETVGPRQYQGFVVKDGEEIVFNTTAPEGKKRNTKKVAYQECEDWITGAADQAEEHAAKIEAGIEEPAKAITCDGCNEEITLTEEDADFAELECPSCQATINIEEEVAEPVVEEAPAKKVIFWTSKRHVDFDKDECECTKCGEIQSFDDFYKDQGHNKHGVQNHCKACIKEYQQARRAAKKAAKEAE